MKRRFLALLLTLAMVLSCLPAQVFAEEVQDLVLTPPDDSDTVESEDILVPEEPLEPDVDGDSGTCGDSVTWTLDSDGVLTISGTGDMYDYGYWGIGDSPWDAVSQSIRSVVVEEGVTSIGEEAIYRCYQLVSVSLPASLKRIGEDAFFQCTKLSQISLPANLTTIERWAFNGCSALESLTIPASVTEIGYDIVSATRITVAEESASYTSDSYGVLFNKEMTQLLEAPTTLQTYVVPDTVTEIGSHAFLDCRDLTSVVLPEGLKSIDYSFVSCRDLKELIIPSTVSDISSGAFQDSGLERIVFNGPVPTFHESAFDNSSPVAFYPADDASWTEDVLQDYGGTVTWVPYTGVAILRQPQKGFALPGGIAEVSLEAHGTGLTYEWYVAAPGSDTFVKSEVTDSTYSVVVDSSNAGQQVYCVVTDEDGNSAQSATVTIDIMEALKEDVPMTATIENGGNCVYYSFTAEHTCKYRFLFEKGDNRIGSILYDVDGNELADCSDSYVNGEDYYYIGLTLEPGETYILCVQFYDSTATGDIEFVMESYHYSDWVVSRQEPTCSSEGSEEWNCGSCNHTWTKVLPAAHKYKNGYCVYCDCEAVLSGSCGENLTWNFYGSTGILTISGTGVMNDFKYYGAPWQIVDDSIRSVVVEEGVTSIGDYAFGGCTELTSVSLPRSLTKTGNRSFYWCTALTTITLPEGLVEIGESSFDGCENLSEVVLPETLTTIKRYAFHQCSSLESITIPANVSDIDFDIVKQTGILVDEANTHYVSDSCGVLFDKEMTELLEAPTTLICYVVPDTVTKLGFHAFIDCRDLTSVVLPEGLESIDSFGSCAKLETLVIPSTVSYIGYGAFQDSGLKAILFAGAAPTFESGAFVSSAPTAYYPADDDSWTEDVLQNYGGTVTWVPYTGVAILRQPESIKAVPGKTAEVSVEAYGVGLTYEWYVAVSGSDSFVKSEITGSTYSTVLDSNSGQQVYCVVTDQAGNSVQSDTVTIDMMGKLEVDTPVTVTIENGGDCTYYSFTPEHSCRYIFWFRNADDASISSLLYDKNGNILADSNNSSINGIPASWVTLEAGETYSLCVRFYDSDTTGVIEVLVEEDHNAWSEVTQEATCTSNGSMTWTCEDCGYVWTEVIPAAHKYEDGYCIFCDCEAVLSGTCGENLTWTFYGSTGILTISGTGDMYDFGYGERPWEAVSQSIRSVVIGDGATSVGEYAFAHCYNLTILQLFHCRTV